MSTLTLYNVYCSLLYIVSHNLESLCTRNQKDLNAQKGVYRGPNRLNRLGTDQKVHVAAGRQDTQKGPQKDYTVKETKKV